MTLKYRLSAMAQADIMDILAWTQARFGSPARLRYEALLTTALRDIADQPERPGSKELPELGANARTWHLRLSRERARTPSGIVQQPRHFLIYRAQDEGVVIGRVLHDAMELERHLNNDASWQ